MNSAESLTRQIQQSVDVVDLISRYVRLARAGRDLKGLCPFHREKTPSFYVVPSKQIFKCFGCGVGGDVFKFIQLREGVPFAEARRILADQAGIRLDSPGASRSAAGEIDRADLARANGWAQKWFARQFESSAAGEAARDYARGRGLTDETIVAAGLGFAPDSWNSMVNAASAAGISDRLLVAAGLAKSRDEGKGIYDGFRKRLMFPIRDNLERVIGFGGRALGDDPAKYLNTPQTAIFDKSRCLYGLERAKDAFSEAGAAILVEGYLDCLMAHQFGFRHAVATLGTSLTEQHVEVLRRHVDELIVVFDSDEAGKRAADRALPLLLTQRLRVRLTSVTDGKDPCDFLLTSGAEAFSELLNSASDALEFKWSQLRRRFHESPTGPRRVEAIREFLELVERAVDWGAFDPIQRGLAVNQIAKLLGIEPRDIHQRLTPSRARAASDEGAGRFDVSARAAGSGDPTVLATREILEVLLNEPGYYERVRDHFLPDRLPSPLREVAREVVLLAEQYGEFSIAELTARFEDVALSGCAIDLQSAGLQRGNYELSLDGALASLAATKRDAAMRVGLIGLRNGGATDGAVLPSGAGLSELVRERGHFLPRKLRRTPGIGDGAGAPPSA